jgi:outer membrane protein assembly factor BamB
MIAWGLSAACCAWALGLFLPRTLWAGDQRQWGQAWNRNLVSEERGLPSSFNPATGENVRWQAALGTESYATPVVAGGRVYIGTNNGEPRDPKHQGDRGVLLCFDDRDGRLLWQWVVPKRTEDPYLDWPHSGISSPATVEGDRVYIVSNRGEVACLDALGMANGNDGPFRDEGTAMSPGGATMEIGSLDADIVWKFDLTEGAGIYSHDAAHSSILILGDHLYLNTGTGVDNTHRKIRTPDAPGLVVLDKGTGRLLAREREGIAPNIFHSTWSPPSLGAVDGRDRIFFAAGNGFLYAFEPLARDRNSQEVATLKKLLQFDFDPSAPKTEVHRFTTNRREGPSNFYGMPVFQDGRIFLAGGGDVFWGKNEAWLKCIRATGAGDVTATATVWSYALEKHTLSTPAVHDGLVYIADTGKRVHCVDGATGQACWTHDARNEFWSSPMVVDGKLFAGTRGGDLLVFAAGREKRILAELNLGAPISATPVAANGSLYFATMTRLFAVATTPVPARAR